MKKTTETNQPIDLSQLDQTAVRVLDVYRRIAGIYERSTAALGRVPKYRVTISNTTSVRIGDGNRSS